MQARQAGKLAGRFIQGSSVEPDSRAERQIYEGVLAYARDGLPDESIATVVQAEDGEPLLVALHDKRLYLLESLPLENEIELARTRCRLVSLDPSRDEAVVEARSHGNMRDEQSRHSNWRFTVRGQTLEIPAHMDSDGECDEREVFAQALAQALGWEFGRSQAAAWQAA